MFQVHEILRVVRDGNAEALEVLLRQDRADVNKFNEVRFHHFLGM